MTATERYRAINFTEIFPGHTRVSGFDSGAQSCVLGAKADQSDNTDKLPHHPHFPITNYLYYIPIPVHVFMYSIEVASSLECQPNYLYQDFEGESSLPNFREINEKLTDIQSAFGVSSKQLAELLNVQHDDIFRWTRQEALPLNHTACRLKYLSSFAEIWNSLSNYPADDMLFEKNEQGLSLYDLLNDDSTNDETIIHNMKQTAIKIKMFFEELRKHSAHETIYSKVNGLDFLDLEAYRLTETNE